MAKVAVGGYVLNRKKKNNQEGSALVIALMVMVLLTLLGLGITRTTDTDVDVSKNDTFHRAAFYHADSGVFTVPKVISQLIDDGAETSISGITYLGSTGTFYREIMGYDAHDTDKDIRFRLGGYNVDVDVNRTGRKNLAGGGVEFASGAEGVGVGSAGGVAVYYDLDSLGAGPSGSQSEVLAQYRKVIGVAGGL